MRYLLIVLGLLMVLLICLPSVQANGVANVDGYVLQDGLYFKNNVAYTRELVWYKD